MKQKRYPVVLSPAEVTALNRFITTGTHKAREIIRARILLLAHEDKSNAAIVRSIGCSAWAARNVRKRFVARGSWQGTIADAPKPGQPRKLTKQHEAFITATACTDPPPGHAHWTIPELKRALLEGYTEVRSISDETVRKVLLGAKLKPWRAKKMWCIPKITPEFRERMEDIIRLYTEPLPKGHALHNFDEASKQLLTTPRGSVPAHPGRNKRTDYEYERHGTRNLFVAVAPFVGTHTVKVTERRKAQDTADFLWQYCMVEHGPRGTVTRPQHIELVMDNLNTHQFGSLKKIWGERKLKLFQRHVTPHFTPKHASWLNLAELEINCIRRQGVKNRIGDEQTLTETVKAIVNERNERKATIGWNFDLNKAKRTFPGLYANG